MGYQRLFPIRVDRPTGMVSDINQPCAEAGFFRYAVDGLEDGVAIIDWPAEGREPRLCYVNPAFAALFEIPAVSPPQLQPEIAQTDNLSAKAAAFWRILGESRQAEGVFSTEFVVPADEGGERRVWRLKLAPIRDQAGEITHCLAVVRDITPQTDLEALARRNERLACIGLLAAGIAHEINNPTGSALLAAETALAIMDSPESGPHVSACLQNIVTSMDRCGRIVRTLLRYSRDEPAERQACSINDVAQQAMELARPYAEQHGAKLGLELDPAAPLAPMNPLEIELVLVNLIRNAVEAGGGRATVSVRTQCVDGMVRVSVADTGCGMNQEQLAHVFDPLYTTRRQAGGSGLGMSIAYGIIQGHAGRMEVQSQPGQGTIVTIDLPIQTENRA